MFSGYKMSKVVNVRLVENSLKEIPPQMIYQYISKGYIKSVTENGKRFVTEEVMNEWCDKYITKRLEKANA